MAPQRVLQLGTSGPLYGAERWILALCRCLDPQRVHSRIGVINDLEDSSSPPLAVAARGLGLACDEIDAPGRFSMAGVRALRRLIQEQSIDIVHSHGYKADAMALLAVCGTRAKVLATPHGWSHGAGAKVRFFEWMDRQMFRLADGVAPLSADLARDLEPMLGRSGRMKLIPNGVDLIEIDAATGIHPDIARLRAKGPVVGYVGQLIARKNLSLLIKAFALWGRKDASLVLVGEGDARVALEAEAANLGIDGQTHFAGWRTDRLEWMRGMDLFVLPSLVEGMPRCLMESMAAGVPVATSDIPGSRDLVHHGETGQLFPVDCARSLADCMASIDAGPQLAEMARRARMVVEQNHSGSAMARQYEGLFREMAA